MNDEKHATVMKQLRGTIRPKLIVTCPGGHDKSDNQGWLRTSCGIHKSQLQGGNYFLHEHVPQGQNLGDDVIHDELMNEKVRDDVSMSDGQSDG